MILATILTKQDLLTQVRLERLVVLGRSRLTRPCLGSALQFQQDSFTIPERTLSCIASAGNTPTTTLDPIHRLLPYTVEEALSRRNPKLSSYTAEILLKRFNYTSVDYVVYEQQTQHHAVNYLTIRCATQHKTTMKRHSICWCLGLITFTNN